MRLSTTLLLASALCAHATPTATRAGPRLAPSKVRRGQMPDGTRVALPATQVANFGDPNTAGVFLRGEDRNPAHVFELGFAPRGDDANLQHHLSFAGNSAYVSVTRSRRTARNYAFGRRGGSGEGSVGFVYVIYPDRMPDGYWIPHIYPADRAVHLNWEFAVAGAIPPSAIHGAFAFRPDEPDPFSYVVNPNYEPGRAGAYDPSLDFSMRQAHSILFVGCAAMVLGSHARLPRSVPEIGADAGGRGDAHDAAAVAVSKPYRREEGVNGRCDAVVGAWVANHGLACEHAAGQGTCKLRVVTAEDSKDRFDHLNVRLELSDDWWAGAYGRIGIHFGRPSANVTLFRSPDGGSFAQMNVNVTRIFGTDRPSLRSLERLVITQHLHGSQFNDQFEIRGILLRAHHVESGLHLEVAKYRAVETWSTKIELPRTRGRKGDGPRSPSYGGEAWSGEVKLEDWHVANTAIAKAGTVHEEM
ncbi:hypothetical protein RJ55_04219 [Drechmeria coniospora]|nr:hypothetical protein RJ55_04219 [Drechmeria coniospora]